jgi:hypothetical protein
LGTNYWKFGGNTWFSCQQTTETTTIITQGVVLGLVTFYYRIGLHMTRCFDCLLCRAVRISNSVRNSHIALCFFFLVSGESEMSFRNSRTDTTRFNFQSFRRTKRYVACRCQQAVPPIICYAIQVDKILIFTPSAMATTIGVPQCPPARQT